VFREVLVHLPGQRWGPRSSRGGYIRSRGAIEMRG
jgi:hypothetical protein